MSNEAVITVSIDLDGARAAIDLVNEMRAKSPSGEHPATSLPDHGNDMTP